MRFTPTLRFFRRDVAARVQPDPADMGTCFGMEATLEAEPVEYRRAASYPLESQSPPSAQESPLAWMSRPRV